MNIQDLKFYEYLKKRKGNEIDELLGIITTIEKDVESICEINRLNFPAFTDHSINHSFRMLDYLFLILSEDLLKEMTNMELFCLILGCLFHDTGMSLAGDKDYVRSNHHLLSQQVIDLYFESKPLLDRRIIKCVSFIAAAHGKDRNELYQDKDFVKIDTIKFQRVRYDILSVLIRVADLMDIESYRSNGIVRVINPTLIDNKVSEIHNGLSDLVEQYKYDSNEIRINIKARYREEHIIWDEWLTWLYQEIIRANTYVFVNGLSKYKLPPLFYHISPSEGSNYKLVNLRFEIDEKGKIWDVIANSVFTNEYDYIRETIQNAIDSCLRVIYESDDSKLPYKSPRCWSNVNYEPEIYIAYSLKDNKILIYDNGMGMSLDQMEKFLFKVADSGNLNFNHPKRNFKFPSISKFGIGFISTLVKTNKIKIYSKSRFEDSKGIFVEIYERNAFVEEMDIEVGTLIELELKNKLDEKSFRSYLLNNFKYISVKFKLLNLDHILDLFNSEKFNNLIKEHCGYLLSEHVLNRTSYCTFCKEIEKEIVNIKKLNRDFIDKEKQNELKEFNNYTSEIEICKIGLKKEKTKTKTNTWVYKLNPQLKIGSILKNPKNPTFLNFGILLINLTYIDYERGIEFDSIHSFFIREGKLVNSLIVSDDSDVKNDRLKNKYGYDAISSFTQEYINLYNDLGDDDSIDQDDIYFLLQDQEQFEESDYVDLINNIDLNAYNYLLGLNRSFYKFRMESEYNNAKTLIKLLEELKSAENLNMFLFNKSYEKYSLLNEMVSTDNREIVYHDDLQKKMIEYDSELYQDGILINGSSSAIIPFGVCQSSINLTADSRLPLNVTRSFISENEALHWLDSVGMDLQNKVLSMIIDEFNKLGLTYELKDFLYTFLSDNDSNYFSSMAYENAKKMILNNKLD